MSFPERSACFAGVLLAGLRPASLLCRKRPIRHQYRCSNALSIMKWCRAKTVDRSNWVAVRWAGISRIGRRPAFQVLARHFVHCKLWNAKGNRRALEETLRRRGTEQCGWLRDKFGVSWKIVPADIGKMMQDKDA